MFDAYLLIDGIPGECLTAGYEEWIQIVGFNHGVAQSANAASGSAGSATTGRTTHSDFSITKALDKATPLLNQYCSKGKTIKLITLVVVRSAGGVPVPYMEYKLNRCIVSSVGISGASGAGDEIPLEAASFNYGTIEWTYTQTDPETGDSGGSTTGTWNLMKNTDKL